MIKNLAKITLKNSQQSLFYNKIIQNQVYTQFSNSKKKPEQLNWNQQKLFIDLENEHKNVTKKFKQSQEGREFDELDELEQKMIDIEYQEKVKQIKSKEAHSHLNKEGFVKILDTEIKSLEKELEVKLQDLRSPDFDNFLLSDLEKSQNKGMNVLDEEKFQLTVDYLQNYFKNNPNYWIQGLVTDTLLYTILYLNLHQPRRKFYVLRDIRLENKSKTYVKVNNKNNFIDTFIKVNQSNVFFVKSQTHKLIDRAILQNLQQLRDYGLQKNRQKGYTYGIACDLKYFVITAYDYQNSEYYMSKPYLVYDYSKKQIDEENLKQFLIQVQAIMQNYKYNLDYVFQKID